MPIRLSKAIKELNIGLSTAVDFLTKKGHKVDGDVNAKISDEQHLLLAKEFNKDMAAKMEAERLTSQVRDAKKADTKKTSIAKETATIEIKAPQIGVKIMGEIDLDNKTGKTPDKTPEVKVETPLETVLSPKQEPKTEPKTEPKPKQETKAETKPEPKQESKQEPAQKPEPKTEAKQKPEPKQEQQKPQQEQAPKQEQKKFQKSHTAEVSDRVIEKGAKEAEIFRLPTKAEETNKPKVLGSIDLTAINTSTRPKKKSKAEKKREREDRIRQEIDAKRNAAKGIKKPQDGAATTATGEQKPRRERFNNKKIDVVKVGSEQKKTTDKTGRKPSFVKPKIDEKDVGQQVKETLARLQGANKNKGKGTKYRRDKRAAASERAQEEFERTEGEKSTLKLTEFVTVSELAALMDVPVNKVIATCMNIGMFVSINQRLDEETINIVSEEFGFSTEYVTQDVVEAIGNDETDSLEDLTPRAPVVTVMGHVDHGKTSLLDYIRKTNVIAGEAGGITQHIGAYNVELENKQQITFLDTPGHEAFTAMRARGAKVTDIAIIIVAADDSVMPQTIEAINHASAAGVPIVFAINKIDKDGANPDKIKEALANMNYLVEEWGGKYQSQDISAKKGVGVSELLEKVLLEAELLDLKANPNRRAVGSIIESSLDKGRGYLSTVLVQNGTLRQGDVVIAGTYFGKVKAMFDERNQRVKEALPAEPVLILGLNGAPQAGDTFNVMASEQEAREITNKRDQLQREMHLRSHKHFTLEELGRRIELGDFKELNVIVKGDVDGSVEALADSLLKLSTDHIQVNVIHKAVGAISDSDVLLAAASNAIVIGFQVRPTTSARKMAEKEDIDVRIYSIIYDAIEEIKAAMEGMLDPEIKEEITATLEVLETFKITKVGTIAGCIVREGKIKRADKVRVIRDGIVVINGELESLKRLKDDVKEVGTNFECGLNVKGYNDVQVGDMIESYTETEVKKKL